MLQKIPNLPLQLFFWVNLFPEILFSGILGLLFLLEEGDILSYFPELSWERGVLFCTP